jgi:pimeloyl-ACP methyl ester carboxylesterase
MRRASTPRSALSSAKDSAPSGSPTASRPRRRLDLPRRVPADADGPIVLVGHSYGGNVISTAATGNDQVKALVYFNGWMCDEGESQQELLERFEGSLVGPSIRPVLFTSADGSEGADLFLDPAAFREAFAADVEQARRTSWPLRNGRMPQPRSPARRWARRRGSRCRAGICSARRTRRSRRRSSGSWPSARTRRSWRCRPLHVSYVSQPDAATQLILQAVEATMPAASRT